MPRMIGFNRVKFAAKVIKSLIFEKKTMRLSYLPFLLIIMPVLEISVFIMIGGQIGVLNTILIILFTAILGSFLLRQQGLGLLAKIQQKMAEGQVPGRDLTHGVMILVAGILLLTPGFVTDAIGFSLFVPQIRDAIAGFLKSRINVQTMGGMGAGGMGAGGGYKRPQEEGVVDLDEADYYDASQNQPEDDLSKKPRLP